MIMDEQAEVLGAGGHGNGFLQQPRYLIEQLMPSAVGRIEKLADEWLGAEDDGAEGGAVLDDRYRAASDGDVTPEAA